MLTRATYWQYLSIRRIPALLIETMGIQAFIQFLWREISPFWEKKSFQEDLPCKRNCVWSRRGVKKQGNTHLHRLGTARSWEGTGSIALLLQSPPKLVHEGNWAMRQSSLSHLLHQGPQFENWMGGLLCCSLHSAPSLRREGALSHCSSPLPLPGQSTGGGLFPDLGFTSLWKCGKSFPPAALPALHSLLSPK